MICINIECPQNYGTTERAKIIQQKKEIHFFIQSYNFEKKNEFENSSETSVLTGNLSCWTSVSVRVCIIKFEQCHNLLPVTIVNSLPRCRFVLLDSFCFAFSLNSLINKDKMNTF